METPVKSEYIQIGSPEWFDLLEMLVTGFRVEELIPHDWLKNAFKIKPLNFEEYPDFISVKKAIADQQFAFLQLFERLRKDVLKAYSLYLVNVRGMGYRFIHPKDQTEYAYDQLLRDLNKSFRECSDIMSHVKITEIDEEQRAKDRILFSKAGHLKQLFQGFK